MSYLEQSTRYIAYDARLGGRYRYFRDPDVLASDLGARYVADMDRLFDSYASLVPIMGEFFKEQFPKDPADSDFVYRQALKAKAFDAVRGILPAASLSNVGIYGTGQGYEALLLRMRAHPLPEARRYADLMLHELRKVIRRSSSGSISTTVAWPGAATCRPIARRWKKWPSGWWATSNPTTPRRSPWSTSIPTPRSSSSPRSSTPTSICPNVSSKNEPGR